MVVLLGLSLGLLQSCSRNDSAATESQDSAALDTEATGVAKHLSDLLFAKCDDGYYAAEQDPNAQRTLVPYAKLVVPSARPSRLSTDDVFRGYSWRGEVVFGIDGSQSGPVNFIYKRAGNWYLEAPKGGSSEQEMDVPVSVLHSVAPSCPKK
jgi:hypothetical protein